MFCISEAYTIFDTMIISLKWAVMTTFLQQQALISLLIRGIVTESSSQQLPYKRGLLLDLTSIYLWYYTWERERERERERGWGWMSRGKPIKQFLSPNCRCQLILRLAWCRETFIQSGSFPSFIMHRVCCSGVWKGDVERFSSMYVRIESKVHAN